MKKSIYLIFIIFLNSCTVLKQLSNEKIETQLNHSTIVFDGKAALLDVNIDNFNSKFLFDTGATFSVLIDSSSIVGFKDKKFGYFGSAKGADKKKIKNKFFTVNLKTNLFESENKVLAFINFPKNKCSKNKTYSGILGMDVFFDNKLSMQLDFTNNKICNISEEQLQLLLIDKNYSLIKSKCKNNQIFIFLTIEEKEYKFKLDTGYMGNIIIPYTDNLNIKNVNKIELEGKAYQTVSGSSNGKETYYEKMLVKLGNNSVLSKLSVSTSIKAQNVGIDFIKGFDWIIDYNNNKVYVKKNNNTIEKDFSRKISYYAKANNDEKLLITVKEKTQTKYNLGDEITEVNNQKITPDNICEMQDLLNKTEDWNTLNIKVNK
jgi:hypothetical protein